MNEYCCFLCLNFEITLIKQKILITQEPTHKNTCCKWLVHIFLQSLIYKSSRPEVYLRKGALKVCSKFTGEYPCRNAISIKLQRNFIEITLWYGCSPVTLLHIFRTPFPRNNCGRLLLNLI